VEDTNTRTRWSGVRIGDLKQAIGELVEFIEAREPQLLSARLYLRRGILGFSDLLGTRLVPFAG